MSFFKASCLAVFLMLFSASANASCYGPAEYEAEQGIRIHSELMVIGLTCQKMPGGSQLYSKYQRFTQRHQGLLAGYESQLINFYRQEGDRNPDGELHTLRTNLANQISKHAIKMSMVSFCQNFSGRLDAALRMDDAAFRSWARQEWPNTRTSRPVCSRHS